MMPLMFVAGLVSLIMGAHILVRGASQLALSLGITPLVVGLTVVSFGTSAPELAISVQSTWTDHVDIALGNVVGSNILNILFVLGLSALIAPLVVAPQLIRQEVPLMVGASLALWWLALDGRIARLDGAILLGLLIAYLLFLIRQSRVAMSETHAEYGREYRRATNWSRHRALQLLLIVGGLVLLVLGAHWLVQAASDLARAWGLSELIIGLTIVAIGTSLPEVATSLVAALRGERDIAVGNIIGSCVFNLLAILGVAALAAPQALPVPPAVLNFDLPVMVAVSLACLPIFFTGHCIARWEGGLFLAYYGAYLAYLLLAAQQHDALDHYGAVMGSVVIPLTAVTLLVIAAREWRARHAASSRPPGA